MCGVAGYSLSKNVRINSKRIAREMLLGIEHRGHDATGFAFRDSTGAFQVHKEDLSASLFVKRRLCVPKQQRTVIMHTRFATQGDPRHNVNNHPVVAGTVVGVHNGHISNDDALFAAIDRVVGRPTRVGEVDSEAAFAVLGYIDAPVTDSLEEIRGGAALAWMDSTDDDDVLHLARLSSSPLIIARTTDGSLFFASTENAVFDGVSAAGLWVEEMLDVNEGEYFTVLNGTVTSAASFTPRRYSYSGGTTTYAEQYGTYGTSTWQSDDYEWQGGRLIRHDDLHAQVEANKRQHAGAVGSVATVSSLSERLAQEEPDVGDTELDRYNQWFIDRGYDTPGDLDEWLALNSDRLADYEAIAAARADDGADETDKIVADLRERVRWSRLPTVSVGVFNTTHRIATPGESEYLADVHHVTRSQAIEKFAENMSDKAKADCAWLLKVYARPGDSVKTQVDGIDYVGHIVTLPDTFPHGEYVLRLYAVNKKRKDGQEIILASKPYHEFEVIGPGKKLTTTADMSEALNA